MGAATVQRMTQVSHILTYFFNPPTYHILYQTDWTLRALSNNKKSDSYQICQRSSFDPG